MSIKSKLVSPFIISGKTAHQLGHAYQRAPSNGSSKIAYAEAVIRRKLFVTQSDLDIALRANPNALLEMLQDPNLAELLVGQIYEPHGRPSPTDLYLKTSVAEEALKKHGLPVAELIVSSPNLSIAPPIAGSLYLITEAALLISQQEPEWIYTRPDLWDHPIAPGDRDPSTLLTHLIDKNPSVASTLANTPILPLDRPISPLVPLSSSWPLSPPLTCCQPWQ